MGNLSKKETNLTLIIWLWSSQPIRLINEMAHLIVDRMFTSLVKPQSKGKMTCKRL